MACVLAMLTGGPETGPGTPEGATGAADQRGEGWAPASRPDDGGKAQGLALTFTEATTDRPMV